MEDPPLASQLIPSPRVCWRTRHQLRHHVFINFANENTHEHIPGQGRPGVDWRRESDSRFLTAGRKSRAAFPKHDPLAPQSNAGWEFSTCPTGF